MGGNYQRAMVVKIKIAYILKQFTDNQEIIDVDGTTVYECLTDLANKYPDMQKWLFNLHNSPLVWVLLNKEIVLPQNMDKLITAEDKIVLIPMVAGG